MDNINGGELEREYELCLRIELLEKFDLRKKKVGDERRRRHVWVIKSEEGRKEGEGNSARDIRRTTLS
jgi:hypothetical protein